MKIEGLLTDEAILAELGKRFAQRRLELQLTQEMLAEQAGVSKRTVERVEAGAYGYEQALQVIRRMGFIPMAAIEEQFRRMVFNIVARNQDDHVKNIAFLMDRSGNWSLSPAFDMTYSYQLGGKWTSHQMTINGKRGDFTLEDFKACAKSASMKRGRAETIIDDVRDIIAQWRDYAEESHVNPEQREKIERALKLEPLP